MRKKDAWIKRDLLNDTQVATVNSDQTADQTFDLQDLESFNEFDENY